MKPIVKFIKDIDLGEGMTGDRSQKLWQLADGRYIITSRTDDPLYRIHETYLFTGDADGKITDWTELPGSRKGEVSHQEAIENFIDASQS